MRANTTSAMILVAGTAFGVMPSRADDGCSVYRVGVPDLDQNRREQGNIDGLPNDGLMFCAPTSVTNYIGYLNNIGFPNLCLGYKDWQNHYAAGTAYINLTNFYCQVDPFDGGSMMPGAREKIEVNYPDDFQVSSWYGISGGPKPQEMYGLMTAGCLMTFCYGRYTFTPPSVNIPVARWVRGGGHCVTLNAVLNGCGPNPMIGYRDPASGGDSDITQSAFATKYWAVAPFTNLYAGNAATFPAVRTHYILNAAFDDGRLRVIDGACVIWATEGLSVDATQGILSAQKYIDLNMGLTTGTPQTTALLLPAVQAAREAAARVHRHPAAPVAVVTLDGDTGGSGPQPGLWRCDLGPKEWTRIGPVPIGESCFGPDGRYFYGASGVINAIDPLTPSESPLVIPSSGHTILALGTSDPLTDGDQFDYELVSISRTSAGGVFVASGDVTGDGCSPFTPQTIPTGVAVPGACEIGVSPIDGSFALTREGFLDILRIGRDTAGAWTVLETITPSPVCTRPMNPHFDNKGRLIYTCGGSVKVLERNATSGQWETKTNSPWHGLASGNSFELGRGRDGLSDWANSPDDFNVDPAEEERMTQGHSQDDCRADFNNDGAVDFFDYDEYVQCFEGVAAACPPNNPASVSLDTDADGAVDFFDYDMFVRLFEAGC